MRNRKAPGTQAPVLVEARPNARRLSSFASKRLPGSGRNHVGPLAHARAFIAARAADHKTPADDARTLTTAIARPDAQDESLARRAIAQPAPTGGNTKRPPVAAGGKFSGRSPSIQMEATIGKKFGYVRTSTAEQHNGINVQIDVLAGT